MISQAQVMSGPLHMTVDSATTLELRGPIAWDPGAAATVINNGSIVFGPDATLNEHAGHPITGLGTERTTLVRTTPLVNLDPGGLGATLSTSMAPDTLTVVRGHLAATDTGGGQSIDRWYALRSSDPITDPVIRFHFDTTELNGANEADLTLERAIASIPFWMSYPGIVDLIGNTVMSSLVDSLGIFTLFPTTLSTGAPDENASDLWTLGPMPAYDRVHLRGPSTMDLKAVVLIDAQGRIARNLGDLGNGSSILLSDLAPGTYFLRSQDRVILPLVHQ